MIGEEDRSSIVYTLCLSVCPSVCLSVSSILLLFTILLPFFSSLLHSEFVTLYPKVSTPLLLALLLLRVLPCSCPNWMLIVRQSKGGANVPYGGVGTKDDLHCLTTTNNNKHAKQQENDKQTNPNGRQKKERGTSSVVIICHLANIDHDVG